MRDSLVDLIARMTVVESVVDSDDSVSWHAHREAEAVDDPSVAQELDDYLAGWPDKRKRMAAYYILGKVGANTASPAFGRILVAYVERERDRAALESLLRAVADPPKSRDLDLGPIFALLGDGRAHIRHAAIRSLVKTDSPEVEGRLLEHASCTQDEYDLTYVNSVLGQVGSSRSHRYLEQASCSRKQDVACSALFALREIGGPELLPVFIERLKSGPSAVKSYAMSAIERHGDERAVPAVVERVKAILRRRRSVQSDPSELVQGLKFLCRYRESDERAESVFARTLPRRMQYLFASERAQLNDLLASRNCRTSGSS